jgi:hypothetical protein
VGGLNGAVAPLLGGVPGAVAPLLGGVTGTVAPLLGGLTGAVAPLLGGVTGLVTPLLGGVTGSVKPLLGGLTGAVAPPMVVGAAVGGLLAQAWQPTLPPAVRLDGSGAAQPPVVTTSSPGAATLPQLNANGVNPRSPESVTGGSGRPLHSPSSPMPWEPRAPAGSSSLAGFGGTSLRLLLVAGLLFELLWLAGRRRRRFPPPNLQPTFVLSLIQRPG